MTLNLDSTWAKLERAREHAQTIKDELAAWFRKNPYTLSEKPNDECTRYAIILNFPVLPPFQRWSLLFADSIHNLRCALDHLIYSVAIHEAGGQDPPPNGDALQFPICDSDSSFIQPNTQRRIKTLSIDVRTAIESMQPYNRPHKFLPPALSLLRDFANTDKHKLLQIVFTAVLSGELNFNVGDDAANIPARFEWFEGEVKDGTEISTLFFDSPAPNVKMGEWTVTLLAMLRHKKGPNNFERTDFAKLLTVMTDEVLNVIDKVVAAVKP